MSIDSIIIRHLGYEGIDMAQVLAAVPEAVRQGVRPDVLLDQRAAVVLARKSRDWADARRQLAAEFEANVRPLLVAQPAHRIQYFGTAPIPLILLLGFKTDTWRAVDAYNHHHVRKDWAWERPDGPAIKVNSNLEQLPRGSAPAEGDVVVRVSVSYQIDPRLTHAMVPKALAEIDIGIDAPALDVIDSPAGVDAVAQRFREALDAIHSTYPNVRTVHVFAAVPSGVAFRMGTVISLTIHPRIQTYELDRAGSTSGYYPALVLQDVGAPRLVPTNAELAALDQERNLWEEELQGLQRLAIGLEKEPRTWAEEVAAPCAAHAGARWGALPSLRQLRSAGSHIDLETREVANDGFVFDASAKQWRVDDGFLLSILRRIPVETSRRCAARLFLLHEGVHDAQCLTQGTASGIGRFGKVLEEIDYQADAWALLYEYRYRCSESPADVRDARAFFRELVRIAIEVMMAFDDASGVSDAMQVRRVSRYLIWSWQFLELERATDLEDCFKVLCEKPVIELTGLATHVEDRRVVCSLRVEGAAMLEVAVYRRSRLYRYGLGGAARLDLIMQSLREHRPEELRARLRAIADPIISGSKS